MLPRVNHLPFIVLTQALVMIYCGLFPMIWMLIYRSVSIYEGEKYLRIVDEGAAFAFHSGTVRQSPDWMQRLGLEWLFRLSQEPRRLWKRYAVTNPRFLFLIVRELLLDKDSNKRGQGC